MRVSTVGSLLRRLVGLAAARPIWTLLLSCLLAAVSVVYALTALTLKTSQRDLLPPRQPSIQRYAEYAREFGDLDDIAVVVEASSVTEAKEYASRLASELRTRQVPLKRIAYRIDPRQFEGRGLLYLSGRAAPEIRDRIFDSQELMEAFAGRPTLDTLVEGISTQVANGFTSGFLDLGLSGARGRGSRASSRTSSGRSRRGSTVRRRTGRRSAPSSRWGRATRAAPATSSPRISACSSSWWSPISRAGSFTDDREAIEGIRATIAALREGFPGVQVGVTGKAVLANDEMTAAFRDSERATALAFVLTLVLLLVAFRRLRKPMLMLAVLAVSLCWSIGSRHPGRRTPLPLLGDVHPHRHRRRHRLRHLLPLSLRGGAVPGADLARGAGRGGGTERPRHGSSGRSARPGPSTSSPSPTSAASRSWGSSPAPRLLFAWIAMMTTFPAILGAHRPSTRAGRGLDDPGGHATATHPRARSWITSRAIPGPCSPSPQR